MLLEAFTKVAAITMLAVVIHASVAGENTDELADDRTRLRSRIDHVDLSCARHFACLQALRGSPAAAGPCDEVVKMFEECERTALFYATSLK